MNRRIIILKNNKGYLGSWANIITGFILLTTIHAGCASYDSGRSAMENRTQSRSLEGRFALPQSIAPPQDIQSVQLHPQNNETAPPVIELGTTSLTLEFDHINSSAQQFRLSISHRGINWEESPLSPNSYLGSFFETTFGGGQQSFTQNPGYRHYSYSFPNDRIQITKSGNYLLSIYDNSTDDLLFRTPFFVVEDEGKLDTRIEQLFTQREDGRTIAQLFSEYRYPAFVQQPQFDLLFFYVQNEFWGRAKQTDLFDTATPDEVHFHLRRKQSFISDYEFNILDLHSFKPEGRQIVEVQPGETPPAIILRRDVQRFSETTSRYPGAISGIPRKDRQAEYGDVHFSLETDQSVSPTDQIYLVGDFNNWVIDERYRMQYDSTRGLWQGKAFIKQGVYAYKYVMLEDKSIKDLALDQGFTDSRQHYMTFVYYLDPDLRFYRLLQVKQTVQ